MAAERVGSRDSGNSSMPPSSDGLFDTARKHAKNAIYVLHGLMIGRPWRPPAAANSP